MKKFYRLSETINKKEDKRVVSVTIKPLLTDMSGTVWITDLMLQEGDRVTGFHPHTETMLQKEREGETIKEPVWYNGIVRGQETLILFNLGKTSTGLDLKLYPKSDMEGIRDFRFGILTKPHRCELLHLVGIGKGRTVKCGDAYIIRVRKILQIRLSIVDVGESHAICSYCIQARY